MDQEDTVDAAHAAAASEPSQMPLPSKAAESAGSIDVVHAAATTEPSQIPSPLEAVESADDDSLSLAGSSTSSGWTENIGSGNTSDHLAFLSTDLAA